MPETDNRINRGFERDPEIESSVDEATDTEDYQLEELED